MRDEKEPSGAQKAFGEFAPDFVHFTDDVLFAGVAAHRAVAQGAQPGHRLGAGRARRQRAAHLSPGPGQAERQHRDELKEAITHIAFYAGWPRAMSAMTVAKQVFGG
jgi:4-carboxymuconolactone decarboxylase